MTNHDNHDNLRSFLSAECHLQKRITRNAETTSVRRYAFTFWHFTTLLLPQLHY
jgi:hypothetical protein